SHPTHRALHSFPTTTLFRSQPDDARLLLARLRRTAPSSPGGLNGEVQGRRPSLIWCPRVRTTIQQRSDRRQRPRSHCPVQGRHRSEEHTSELQSLAYLVCRL